ncbi:hypothetical protein PYCCODRAFT_12473 [Trametes coccinea BRFM310]|uniref:Uncharacterized protein n=1 Tax=Trametes coccinea (strain BRFM310) TaxID=1353009 RepID=A0A1Y2J4L6_TRAC3|nr:hypothetical protein PYCCODRAFT_12473 [Trametes coccinea BRFM310]
MLRASGSGHQQVSSQYWVKNWLKNSTVTFGGPYVPTAADVLPDEFDFLVNHRRRYETRSIGLLGLQSTAEVTGQSAGRTAEDRVVSMPFHGTAKHGCTSAVELTEHAAGAPAQACIRRDVCAGAFERQLEGSGPGLSFIDIPVLALVRLCSESCIRSRDSSSHRLPDKSCHVASTPFPFLGYRPHQRYRQVMFSRRADAH